MTAKKKNEELNQNQNNQMIEQKTNSPQQKQKRSQTTNKKNVSLNQKEINLFEVFNIKIGILFKK